MVKIEHQTKSSIAISNSSPVYMYGVPFSKSEDGKVIRYKQDGRFDTYTSYKDNGQFWKLMTTDRQGNIWVKNKKSGLVVYS